MSPRPLFAFAVWDDHQDAGRLPEPQVRRLQLLIPLFLAGAAALGASGLLEVDLQPPPRPVPVPVLAERDGLPEVMVEGRIYTATIRITFPADWRGHNDDPLATVVVWGRGTPDDAPDEEESELLYCASMDHMPAAGRIITVDCLLDAPSPGPFDLHVMAGDGFIAALSSDSAASQNPTVTRTYRHMVRPA